MRISDWSSDVCSSDLHAVARSLHLSAVAAEEIELPGGIEAGLELAGDLAAAGGRSAAPAGRGSGAVDGGIEDAAGLAIAGPRFADARLGGRDIEVAGDSLLDERIEPGVAQPPPPPLQQRRAGRRKIGRAHV